MSSPRPPLYRRLIPGVLTAVFLLMTVIALTRVVEIRQKLHSRTLDELEDALVEGVAAWEDSIVSTLTDAMESAASEPEHAELRQAMLRKKLPSFNSLYLWFTPRPADGPASLFAPREADFVFPARATVESQSSLRRMCLRRARAMGGDPLADPARIAWAFESGCRHEDLSVRLIAATEAATVLQAAGFLDDALVALGKPGIPKSLRLVDAARQGVAPSRISSQRNQRAEILLAQGHTDKALDLYYRNGLEITELDAPDAIPVLQYLTWPILARLRQYQRYAEAERIEMMKSKVERRVAAYREIKDRIVLGTSPNTSATEPPRFIYDQYSEPPFLLFYGPTALGDGGVALQLEQPVLISELLRHPTLRSLRRHIAITDAAGAWVAGGHRGGEIAITVPFTRTLTHLRVGLRQSVVDLRAARLSDQWITPLVLILVCAILGFTALIVQVRASRQQQRLLQRQREFTTRVTHELKTPLAGIRVMAENLEVGAFRDTRQMRDMASRIMAETDRLTERVDQVLAASRSSSIPQARPFDPEEAVLEAIDQWGPRLEHFGVRFVADLEATDEVNGDQNAIRDAVGCLLDNALKYRREDIDDPSVELELNQSGPWVTIAVTDNGLGVPPRMRKSIFDPFVRVEGPNRGKAGGHGLGLSQVQQIAAAHKGRVECREGRDGGAKFVLRLPALTRK